MKENYFYTLHRYDGYTQILNLKELFEVMTVHKFNAVVGYSTDFGKCVDGYYKSSFGKQYALSVCHEGYKVTYEYLYFVTNPLGKLVHPKQLISEYCKEFNPTHSLYTGVYYSFYYRLRCGYKRKHGRSYREMKTTQERRAVSAVLREEGEPEFRGERANLPNKWDDFYIYYQRSWKTQSKRRKQYKGS